MDALVPSSVVLTFRRHDNDTSWFEEISAHSSGTMGRRRLGESGSWRAFNLLVPNPDGCPQPPLSAAIAALRGQREVVREIFTCLYPDQPLMHHGGYEIVGLAIDRPYADDPESPCFIGIEGSGSPLMLSPVVADALAATLELADNAVAAVVDPTSRPPLDFNLLNEYIVLVAYRVAHTPLSAPSAREAELHRLLVLGLFENAPRCGSTGEPAGGGPVSARASRPCADLDRLDPHQPADRMGRCTGKGGLS